MENHGRKRFWNLRTTVLSQVLGPTSYKAFVMLYSNYIPSGSPLPTPCQCYSLLGCLPGVYYAREALKVLTCRKNIIRPNPFFVDANSFFSLFYLGSRINIMYIIKKQKNINEKWTMDENFPASHVSFSGGSIPYIPSSWYPNPQPTLVAASPESRKAAVPGATWEISKRPICAWRSKADVG